MKGTLGRVLCLSAVLACSGCAGGDSFDSAGFAVHTVCGSPTTVAGIDVSKWQGTVSWSSVRSAGIEFAFARVSDGTTVIDQQFPTNWPGMKSAGIIRGAYQYFRPDQDAAAQANLLISAVQAAGGMEPGDLPAVLDLEATGGVASAAVIQAADLWLGLVKHGTGKVPIIYTGPYFWDDHSYGASLSSYPLWTAHYTIAGCPLVPDAWSGWAFWQYTDSGTVSGVAEAVDGDRFNGTLVDLQHFIEKSNVQGPADAAPPLDASAADRPQTDGPVPDGPVPDGGVAGDAVGSGEESGDSPPAGGCGCVLESRGPDGAGVALALAALTLLAGARLRRARRAAACARGCSALRALSSLPLVPATPRRDDSRGAPKVPDRRRLSRHSRQMWQS